MNFNGVAGTSIFSLFSGISNKGSDADVASKDNGAIGFADSNGSLLSLGSLNFGADGRSVARMRPGRLMRSTF